jgi:hypothetical protein
MRIHREKLSAELKSTAHEIKLVKSIFRESGQPRLKWGHYGQLSSLKSAATILCSIQAHFRGRIHMKGSSLEEQARFIEGCFEEYKLEEQAA